MLLLLVMESLVFTMTGVVVVDVVVTIVGVVVVVNLPR